MKAYKGCNADMTCRGFQYKEGETYHEDIADLSERAVKPPPLGVGI